MKHDYLPFEKNSDEIYTSSFLLSKIKKNINLFRNNYKIPEGFNDIANELERLCEELNFNPDVELRNISNKILELTRLTDPDELDEENPFRKLGLYLADISKNHDREKFKLFKENDPACLFKKYLSDDDKKLNEVKKFFKKTDYSLFDDFEILKKQKNVRFGLLTRLGVELSNIALEINGVKISMNHFIEWCRQKLEIKTSFPFSRAYQRFINQINHVEYSDANKQLLESLEELFYRIDLTEIQKLQRMRATILNSLQNLNDSLIPSLLQIIDPFYVAFTELPEQFKKLAEVQHLVQTTDQTLYEKNNNIESTKKSIAQNRGLLIRLREIIVHQIDQIPNQTEIINKWDEFHRRKDLVDNLDAEISELKKSIRRDYPFSFFYQQLRFELNEVIKQFPDKNIDQLYIALDRIHLSNNDEKEKLQKFEQDVINFYYHEVRQKEGICDTKLGDILLDFLKSPIKLNLEEKYDIKIPASYDPEINAPQIDLSKEKPVRVVKIDIGELFINFDKSDEQLKINYPQLIKLKKEYDQMELIINISPEQKGRIEQSLKNERFVIATGKDEIKLSSEEKRIKTALKMLKGEGVVNYTQGKIIHLYPGRIIDTKAYNTDKSFIHALEKYRTSRLLEEFEDGSKYNSLFGWSWFFVQSSDVKRSAAKKLSDYKNDFPEARFDKLEPFTEEELRALKTDRLGELLKLYDCQIDTIQRELIGVQNSGVKEQNFINI